MAKAVKQKPVQEVEQAERWFVRATKVGVYDNGNGARRYYPDGYDHPRAGEIFELIPKEGMTKSKKVGGKLTPIVLTPEQQFSPNWMERVDDREAKTDMDQRARQPRRPAVITKPAAERSVI